MKKNGFTLVELLAVVSIISLLLLLVIPKIVNQLNNSKENINNVTKKIIYNATEKYLKDYNIDFKDEEIKCISIEELQEDKYLSKIITDNKSGLDLNDTKVVKVNYKESSGYSYQLVNKDACYEESGMLVQGLTPVNYDGDNWVVVSSANKNNEWYNYDKQQWANAVVLSKEAKGNHKDEVGSIITVEGENPDALMMLVWIPRYEYRIQEPYGKGGISLDQPGEIEVNLIDKSKKTATDGYHIHPAFKFGDKDLSGIWVGKFEISHKTKSLGIGTNNSDYEAAILNCTTIKCSEASNLRILPNVPSLRYNNVSNFWYSIKSIENTSVFGLSNMDTHMMKNSEWGAVAYLSQSKYGKYGNSDYTGTNKEVYNNKSIDYKTGSSNGALFDDYRQGDQCKYNNMSNLGEGKGQCGPGASTTGNIYGVYDMSGGAFEYVMGVYSYPSFIIDSKYYDIYMTSNSLTACGDNETCYGHALSETYAWYGDDTSMIDSSNPWFIRGGICYDQSIYPGVFSFTNYSGSGVNDTSARFVGVRK